MPLLLLAGALAVLSIAMVFAMVRSSRASLDERDRRPDDRSRAALEPAVEPPVPLEQRAMVLAVRALRWIASLAVAVIVMAIGENLAPLRRVDAFLAPRRLELQLFFATLLAAGFAMFMGGIIHMVLRSRSTRDGEFTFAEVQSAWQEGTWRDSVRMRRFFLIAGGVALATLSGAVLLIIAAPPGIKLLVILAVGYAIVRITASLRTARGSR